MTQLIECVPNFSEGRNQSKVNAIADEISKVQDVELIGMCNINQSINCSLLLPMFFL